MNIRMYAAAGFWWHGVVINGRVYLIGCIGRVGDCVRP